MPYRVLAFDFDGTVARHGVVEDSTIDGLQRWRDSGRRLMIVTGRQLDDLECIFPQLALCDIGVLENGAVLYDPADASVELLAEPAPPNLVATMHRHGVDPLWVGRVLIASWEHQVGKVERALAECGIRREVILNKGSAMFLPVGVDKALGLLAGLDRLGEEAEHTVGVGDAENDLVFLRRCGLSAAPANALDEVRRAVDVPLERTHGAGVVELIDSILADDFASDATRHAPSAVA